MGGFAREAACTVLYCTVLVRGEDRLLRDGLSCSSGNDWRRSASAPGRQLLLWNLIRPSKKPNTWLAAIRLQSSPPGLSCRRQAQSYYSVVKPACQIDCLGRLASRTRLTTPFVPPSPSTLLGTVHLPPPCCFWSNRAGEGSLRRFSIRIDRQRELDQFLAIMFPPCARCLSSSIIGVSEQLPHERS
jgi:hypothetical protein